MAWLSGNVAGMKHSEETIDKVVSGGYCVGCGGCAVADKNIAVQITDDGRYQAQLSKTTTTGALSQVCPFASNHNESTLAQDIFNDAAINRSPIIGNYLESYAGYVADGDFRKNGSSGGMGSWICAALLKTGLVDGIIHVKPSAQHHQAKHGHPYFEYAISKTENELLEGAKSHYYPIEVSKILNSIEGDGKRYLFVGLPCFVKALRLLQIHNPQLKAQIPYTMGLVCGHLKTMQFSDHYAYAFRLDAQAYRTINFRHKLDKHKVSDYGVAITTHDGNDTIRVNRSILGSNWGHGFFKNNACDYCDDVFSETADIVIGDAWLPEFEDDWRGNNILIVRNRTLLEMVQKSIQSNSLHLQPLSLEKTIKSQDSGVRHRRDGLAYRLWLKDQKKTWRPTKRVTPSPSKDKPLYFRATQQFRMLIAQQSRMMFKHVSSRMHYKLFNLYMRVLVKGFRLIEIATRKFG